ncbi:hypothetical protein GGR50DRAFT_697768 [Xylaria sp. CBS 124048]|nr:hypothetical protein GGR50DRAFT_697768 [Xylaria sp. CBS 124048]
MALLAAKMKMSSLAAWFGEEIWFLFDVDIGLSTPEMKTSRLRAAQTCWTLRDVIREDKLSLMAFILVVAVQAGVLYCLVAPRSIFDYRYVLTVLYSLYVLGTMVLVFLAARDRATIPPLNTMLWEMWRPAVSDRCPICFDDSPDMGDLVQLQCCSDEEAEARPETALHTFHMICILTTLTDQEKEGADHPNFQFACPLCRQAPKTFRRIYQPVGPGAFDHSRLMWYILSLYTRRMKVSDKNPIWGSVQGRGVPVMKPLPPGKVYLKALLEVQPLHFAMMTRFVIFARMVYLAGRMLVDKMPFVNGWRMAFAVGFALLTITNIVIVMMACAERVTMGFPPCLIRRLVRMCNYFSPSLPITLDEKPAIPVPPPRYFSSGRQRRTGRFSSLDVVNKVRPSTIRILKALGVQVAALVLCIYLFSRRAD